MAPLYNIYQSLDTENQDRVNVIMESKDARIIAYFIECQGLISQRRGNASYFYHYDGLGSTKALTDANQNIQASYKYDAWGNILQTSGTITNPYLYVGELGYYGDGDSGMYLLTQRWYNPVIGRFVVKDPLNANEDYLYRGGEPINNIDPLGLVPQKPRPKPGSIPQPPDKWRGCAKSALDRFCKGMKLKGHDIDGKEVNIDWKVIRCMIWAESNDNPNEKRAGPKGLMQIAPVSEGNCPEAFKRMGIKHCYKWDDPCDNIICGVYRLCRAKGGSIDRYGTEHYKGSKFDKCMRSYKP